MKFFTCKGGEMQIIEVATKTGKKKEIPCDRMAGDFAVHGRYLIVATGIYNYSLVHVPTGAHVRAYADRDDSYAALEALKAFSMPETDIDKIPQEKLTDLLKIIEEIKP